MPDAWVPWERGSRRAGGWKTRGVYSSTKPKPTALQPLHSTNTPFTGWGGTPLTPGLSTPQATLLPGFPIPFHPPQASSPPPLPGAGARWGDARGPRLGRFLPAPGRWLGGGRRGGSGCRAGIPTLQQAGLVSAGGSQPPSFPTRFYSLHCPIAAGRAPGGGCGGRAHLGPLLAAPPGSELGGGQQGEAEPRAPASPWDPLPSAPLGSPQPNTPEPPTAAGARLGYQNLGGGTGVMLRHPGEGPESPRGPLGR